MATGIRQIFEPNGSWSRQARYWAFAPLIVAVLAGFVYVRVYGVDFFWRDSWSIVELLEQHQNGSLSLDSFWTPHNEHRVFLPNLIFFGMTILTHGRMTSCMYLTLLTLLASLLAYLTAFRERFPSGWAMWLAVPIAFLVFSLRQYELMLWEFELSFVMPLVGAILAFFALSRMRNDRFSLMFSLAAFSAAVAAFSSAHGLLAWPIAFLEILILSLEKRRKIMLAGVWAFLAAAVWGIYFFHWTHPGYHPAMHLSPSYLLVLVGASLFGLPQPAMIAGAAILVLAMAAVAFSLQRRRLSEDSFWLAVLLFSLMTAVTITCGRAGFGASQAKASRYACIVIPLVIATYVLLIPKIGDAWRRIRIVTVAALAILMCVGAAVSVREGLVMGRWWRELMLYGQSVLVTADSQPASILHIYCLDANDLFHHAKTLETLKYGPFADPDFLKKNAMLPASLPVLSGATQFGMLQPRGSLALDDAVVVLEGWAVDWPEKSKPGRLAGGVAVVVDGHAYPARYGFDSEAAVQTLGDEKYRHSGFLCLVSVKHFKRGAHSISLKIASEDRKGVYCTDKAGFNL